MIAVNLKLVSQEQMLGDWHRKQRENKSLYIIHKIKLETRAITALEATFLIRLELEVEKEFHGK